MPVKKTNKKNIKTNAKKSVKNERVSFLGAVQSYWMGYVNFKDTATRAQYWWSVLFVFLVGFVFNIIGNPILATVVSAIMFLPSRAMAFRRFHDVGLSGLWNLVPVLFFMIWGGIRADVWLFMLNLEWIPRDLTVFMIACSIWVIFNFIVVVQPSRIQNNKYRK